MKTKYKILISVIIVCVILVVVGVQFINQKRADQKETILQMFIENYQEASSKEKSLLLDQLIRDFEKLKPIRLTPAAVDWYLLKGSSAYCQALRSDMERYSAEYSAAVKEGAPQFILNEIFQDLMWAVDDYVYDCPSLMA